MTKLNGDVELQKALKRVKTAHRIRIVFMFLSLLMVLFVFYGNKFAMETSWYPAGRTMIYNVLFIVILIMLLASLAKVFFAGKYNQILKEKGKK